MKDKTASAILAAIILIFSAGCSSVKVSRGPDTLDVRYSSLFTDVQAPSLDVQKEGDYTAKFNAEGIDRGLTVEEAQALLKVLGIIAGD